MASYQPEMEFWPIIGFPVLNSIWLSPIPRSSWGWILKTRLFVGQGPQWFMWGGWLNDTHILNQSKSHTGPHGVGFKRHVYIEGKVHNGSCGMGVSMIHTFSASQSSTLVLMGWDLKETSIYRTRSTMVHVGWVAGWYIHSPPVKDPHLSS